MKDIKTYVVCRELETKLRNIKHYHKGNSLLLSFVAKRDESCSSLITEESVCVFVVRFLGYLA